MDSRNDLQPAWEQPDWEEPVYAEADYEDTEILEGSVEEPFGTPQLPMKWHNLLVWFLLWFGAIRNLFGLIGNILGFIRDIPSFAEFPLVPPVYLINSAFVVAAIVLGLRARSALAQFRKNGPRLLLWFYGVAALNAFLLPLMHALAMGLPLVDALQMRFLGSVLMLILNNKYYCRRRHLFVN